MKKTLTLILVFVMTIATVITTVSIASANAASEDVKYIDASLNEVAVDGKLDLVVGANNKFAEDKITLVEAGTASTAEYVMDNAIANATLGAAWDQAKETLYIAISAKDALADITIEIGGKAVKVDPLLGGAVTGIDNGESALSEDDKIIEIALPIKGLELKSNSRYIYTDLKITVETISDSAEFEGALQFTEYSANFVHNATQQTASIDKGATGGGVSPTVSADQVLNMKDEVANNSDNVRTYALYKTNAAITLTKNFYVEFDMNVKSMPATEVFNGGPDKWAGECKDGHMWCVIRSYYKDQFYFNIINTADDGIVMLIQAGVSPWAAEAQKVVLGKQLGEGFRLKIEWSEENVGIISVDGKVVYVTDKTSHDSTFIGSSTGFVMFNTGRVNPLGVGESIDVDIANFSTGIKSATYDAEALAALSSIKVDVPNAPSVDTTDPDDSTDTTAPDSSDVGSSDSTADTSDTTSDDNVDTTAGDDTTDNSGEATTAANTTTPVDDGGCASSLAAYGAVMAVSTALMAVVAASKKKED